MCVWPTIVKRVMCRNEIQNKKVFHNILCTLIDNMTRRPGVSLYSV